VAGRQGTWISGRGGDSSKVAKVGGAEASKNTQPQNLESLRQGSLAKKSAEKIKENCRPQKQNPENSSIHQLPELKRSAKLLEEG